MSPPDTKSQEEESPDETDAVAEGDVDALLALAKTRRAAKDLKGCYEAYKSAADLGSMEAEYAVALFVMNGSVVPQDLKEGTMRLRSAADKGSIPAKVYLGNLYELGIHYKADPEKRPDPTSTRRRSRISDAFVTCWRGSRAARWTKRRRLVFSRARRPTVTGSR